MIDYGGYITNDTFLEMYIAKNLSSALLLSSITYLSNIPLPSLQTLIMSMQPISLSSALTQLFEPCSLSSDGLYLFPIPFVGNRYKPFEESLSLWLTSPFLQTIINNYMWQCPQLVEPCSLQVYICSRFQAQSGLVFESESKDSTCS